MPIMVDWNVDWVPPRYSQSHSWDPEASNDLTPGKHSVGTEINPSFWKRAINLSPWFHWHHSISTTWKISMCNLLHRDVFAFAFTEFSNKRWLLSEFWQKIYIRNFFTFIVILTYNFQTKYFIIKISIVKPSIFLL